MQPTLDIIELLINNGAITKIQADEAKKEASRVRPAVTPIVVLMGRNIIDEAIVVEAVGKSYNIPVIVNVLDQPVNAEAASRVPESFASANLVLPLDLSVDTLTVVVPVKHARNITLRDDIKRLAAVRRVVFSLSTAGEIQKGIIRAYRAESEMRKIVDAAEVENKSKPQEDNLANEIENDSQIIRFVNLAINQAITDGASDIHIEPDEHEIRVRFRIDGVLHDINSAPPSIGGEITSRIKILADMDIAEKRKPQDGRLSVAHAKKGKIDLRVACLPTVWGEKIVMRILDNSQANLELSKLGFSDANFARFSSAYKKPYGMILVTGPTGSGKSTTLYAALNQIASPDVNVITVEDPVEYRIRRINQVQVNPKAGMTFAGALRSILRSDPDVILIGEIRDHETAQIAVEAGLTGHLVLSTLHTNDASSAVVRLAEMGIEPFLVGSVVEAVLAQRLVRKLCKNCKQPYVPTPEELISAGYWDATRKETEVPAIYRQKGCSECAQTGYKGRMAIHEVLLVDDEVEKIIVSGGTSPEIEAYARSAGMKTLREDGWLKVTEGSTSIAEILRVVA